MNAKKKPSARTRFVARCTAQEHGVSYVIKDAEGGVYHGTEAKAEALAVAHFKRQHLTIEGKRVTIERDVKIRVREV